MAMKADCGGIKPIPLIKKGAGRSATKGTSKGTGKSTSKGKKK